MEYEIDENTSIGELKNEDTLYFTKQGKDTLTLKGLKRLKEALLQFSTENE